MRTTVTIIFCVGSLIFRITERRGPVKKMCALPYLSLGTGCHLLGFASPKSDLHVAVTRQNTIENRNINSFTKDTTECQHSTTVIDQRLPAVRFHHALWHPGYKLSYCKHQYMCHNCELISTSPGLSLSFNFHAVNLFWVVMLCQLMCSS
jgi:hypothetical protein